MKSHRYGGSLSNHPIPEHNVLRESPVGSDDTLSCAGSRSDSTCSSLREEENDSSVHYPPDLLGVSWGSYLHSGPPTGGRTSRRVVINTEPQTSPSKILSSASPVVTEEETVTSSSPSRSRPRSILRTPVAKDASAGKLGPNAEGNGARSEPLPLLQALLSLVDSLSKARDELRGSGVDTSPLSSVCDAFEASSRRLKQALESEGGRELAAGGMLQAAASCLEAVVLGIVRQGKLVQKEAAFLQQTGAQLGKSQQAFLQEQQDIRRGMETARAELMAEKVLCNSYHNLMSLTHLIYNSLCICDSRRYHIGAS